MLSFGCAVSYGGVLVALFFCASTAWLDQQPVFSVDSCKQRVCNCMVVALLHLQARVVQLVGGVALLPRPMQLQCPLGKAKHVRLSLSHQWFSR